jgi:DNA-binding transcriptional regulator YdaS (Cro superfamily)
MQDSRFNRAVAIFGSQKDLAHALGVTPGLVAQWRRRGVPTERCFEIERLSRQMASEKGDETLVIACEELRPDLPWCVVRANPLPCAAAEPS